MTDTRARQLFDSYFKQYREHYGDTLADRYGTYSDAKRVSYDTLNETLLARHHVYQEGDRDYTVLSANAHTYTCGAIYPVTFEDTPLKVYVFEVHTAKHTYAWYISSDSFSAGYIAPVPANRTQGHQDVRSATMTEEALDRAMRQEHLSDEHRHLVERYLHDGYLLGAFAKAHRHLVDAAYIDAFGQHYTARDSKGRPVDDWTKTSDGWLDTTVRAQLQYDNEQAKMDERRAEHLETILGADSREDTPCE